MRYTSRLLLSCLMAITLGCHHAGNSSSESTTNTPVDNSTSVTQNCNIIQNGASVATSFGLQTWNVSDPNSAHMTALQIKDVVNTLVLPYLNSATGVASSAVEVTLSDNFFGKLPSYASAFISLAASALDTFLPAPSPTSYMSADHVAYLKAFFTGVSNGADAFLGGNAAKHYRAARSPGRWFSNPHSSRDLPAEVVTPCGPETRAIPEPQTIYVPCPQCEPQTKDRHRSYGLFNIHVEKR